LARRGYRAGRTPVWILAPMTYFDSLIQVRCTDSLRHCRRPGEDGGTPLPCKFEKYHNTMSTGLWWTVQLISLPGSGLLCRALGIKPPPCRL
jgi:hypothetical protein